MAPKKLVNLPSVCMCTPCFKFVSFTYKMSCNLKVKELILNKGYCIEKGRWLLNEPFKP